MPIFLIVDLFTHLYQGMPYSTSRRHPSKYLYSDEDGKIICWNLDTRKVIFELLMDTKIKDDKPIPLSITHYSEEDDWILLIQLKNGQVRKYRLSFSNAHLEYKFVESVSVGSHTFFRLTSPIAMSIFYRTLRNVSLKRL